MGWVRDIVLTLFVLGALLGGLLAIPILLLLVIGVVILFCVFLIYAYIHDSRVRQETGENENLDKKKSRYTTEPGPR